MDIEKLRDGAYNYFNGKILPIAVMLGGILIYFISMFLRRGVKAAFMVVGILAFIVGFVMSRIEKRHSSPQDEKIVDELIDRQLDIIHDRAYNKLNLERIQVDIIDPLLLYGPINGAVKKDNRNWLVRIVSAIISILVFVITLIVTLVNKLTKKRGFTDKSRVGSDGKRRYSYNQFTVFLFDRNQVYIYFANVDITSGNIYEEGTYEYYYRDIVSVSTDRRAGYSSSKKRKVSVKVSENMTVYTAGCSYTASVSTNMEHTVIDRQFMAMRELIREIKQDRMIRQ